MTQEINKAFHEAAGKRRVAEREGMMQNNHCTVCKQTHDGTGCPTDRPIYDEAMDVIAKKDAEIAALKERVAYLQNDNTERYARIKELEREIQRREDYLDSILT